MAWIKELDISENQKLYDLFQNAEKRTNNPVANVLRVHSVNPDVLECHMNLYERIMFGEGELSLSEREMIGVVVSMANECPYCVGHHSMALFHITENHDLMNKVIENYQETDLSKREFAICGNVYKLTKTPFQIVEDDIVTLRELGMSDKAIFDVNQICAYFNYVNRIVHGLGVNFEDV